MSARLLQYRLSDQAIVSLWESSQPTLLAAQIKAEDATYGYLLLDETHAIAEVSADLVPQQWHVNGTGDDAVTKTVVTITASPNPFTADAVEVCSITVSAFVECTLLLNGTPYALTTGDTTIELTSDVPQLFHVELQSMVTHWAAPIDVEAT